MLNSKHNVANDQDLILHEDNFLAGCVVLLIKQTIQTYTKLFDPLTLVSYFTKIKDT